MNKELRELQALEAELDRAIIRKHLNKLADYRPYMKQMEFHALGAFKRERLLMAGNQQGKTYAGAAETAMHLTGLYPDDWPGRVWDRPVNGWAGGVTSLAVRDIAQSQLLGPDIHNPGGGAVPKDCIGRITMARGVQDAVDTVLIKHKTGGWSSVAFKSYEQGRLKWQGTSKDFIWLDEEPQYEVYSEALSRTNATAGMVFMTFTPLLGMSTVVKRFLQDTNPDRGKVNMTIDDAEHISPEQRKKIIDGYEEYERDARVKGLPMLGEGRVFITPEEFITCEPIEIPTYWTVMIGLDIGIDHPTAAAKIAWDRDTDTIYVLAVYRQANAAIPIHAAAMRAWGEGIPVAWPHDAHSRDKGSGLVIKNQYKACGLNMMHEHAQFSKDDGGGNSVEAGISDMNERMKDGRFKVSRVCTEFFNEYRLYHRKDGQIVKIDDDLISAIRYGIMMKRHSRPLSEVGGAKTRRKTRAKGLDFNLT